MNVVSVQTHNIHSGHRQKDFLYRRIEVSRLLLALRCLLSVSDPILVVKDMNI